MSDLELGFVCIFCMLLLAGCPSGSSDSATLDSKAATETGEADSEQSVCPTQNPEQIDCEHTEGWIWVFDGSSCVLKNRCFARVPGAYGSAEKCIEACAAEACIPESMMWHEDAGFGCCEGLGKISAVCLDDVTYDFACTQCGNGICTAPEEHCNCPADCE